MRHTHHTGHGVYHEVHIDRNSYNRHWWPIQYMLHIGWPTYNFRVILLCVTRCTHRCNAAFCYSCKS